MSCAVYCLLQHVIVYLVQHDIFWPKGGGLCIVKSEIYVRAARFYRTWPNLVTMRPWPLPGVWIVCGVI